MTEIQKIIERYRYLEDNWDSEGSPKPSEASIERAQEFLKNVEEKLPIIQYVDPDVLGGVAIVVASKSKKRRAWFSFLNNGKDSVVSIYKTEKGSAAVDWSEPLNDETINKTLEYLND